MPRTAPPPNPQEPRLRGANLEVAAAHLPSRASAKLAGARSRIPSPPHVVKSVNIVVTPEASREGHRRRKPLHRQTPARRDQNRTEIPQAARRAEARNASGTAEIVVDDLATRPTTNAILFGYKMLAGTLEGDIRVTGASRHRLDGLAESWPNPNSPSPRAATTRTRSARCIVDSPCSLRTGSRVVEPRKPSRPASAFRRCAYATRASPIARASPAIAADIRARESAEKGVGVKFFPLVWAGLWRRPVRSILTAICIAIAFVLLGLLQGVNAGFERGIANAQRDVLISRPRVRGGAEMPISAIEEIRKIPGVKEVAPRAYFIGR